MMIGGIDLTLEGAPDDSEYDLLYRVVRTIWIDAVLLDADAEETTPVGVTWALENRWRPREFFILQDLSVVDKLDAYGVIDELKHLFVHVLWGKGSIGFVVHEHSGDPKRLVEDITAVIRVRRDRRV